MYTVLRPLPNGLSFMPLVDAETPDFLIGTLIEDAAEPLGSLKSGELSPDGTTYVVVEEDSADV